MKYHIRIIRELIALLRAAILEIREHNAEYQHNTPESYLAAWEQKIQTVEDEL